MAPRSPSSPTLDLIESGHIEGPETGFVVF